MLRTALKAGLPLITAVTTDLVNVGAVLDAYVEEEGRSFSLYSPSGLPKESLLYCVGVVPKIVEQVLYGQLAHKNSTLVIVNPPTPVISAFDVGELHPPKSMVRELLSSIVEEEDMSTVLASMSDLSLKEAGEVASIAMSSYHSLTAETVAKAKRFITKDTKGLSYVGTEAVYYAPQPRLIEWLGTEGYFLTNSPVSALRPRGLLLVGGAGTGKTEGAKYLARELGLPMYRLNIGELMGKYVGESEGNMLASLRRAEKESPCVLLIDEVEKLFNTNDDSGVGTRLLSQLLWWLQEHNSEVLTVMTANNKDSIPPELYREGRIDEVMYFEELTADAATALASEYIERLNIPQIPKDEAGSFIAYHGDTGFTPAEVVQGANMAVKAYLLDKLKQ